MFRRFIANRFHILRLRTHFISHTLFSYIVNQVLKCREVTALQFHKHHGVGEGALGGGMGLIES